MRRFSTAVPLALVLALLAGPLAAPLAAQEERLDRAQALLDEGRPVAAVEALGPLLAKNDPRALLLRSTAHFMEGRMDEGRADLDRVLKLDPGLRQAWLNRAGLDIAGGDYDRALQALERARAIDPSAPDSHLNIGAVLLLQGHLAEATESFERYLAAAGSSGEAHYLVATNYAGRGYARLATLSLGRSIAIDESFRLRARTDPNFEAIAEAPELRALMATDSYRPAAGDHVASRSFPVPYEGGDGALLSAVLEAMRTVGEPFDPRVESTPEWGAVHGEIRVGLRDRASSEGAGGIDGVLTLSAPAARMSGEEWRRRAHRLLEAVELTLLRRRRTLEPGQVSSGEPPGD